MLFSQAALHIPDGFLNLVISLVFWVLTIIIIGVAISKTNQSLGEKQIPLMGVMAAFIFAAQMINFPVAGGTSGHFLGGALAAIILGPWAGMLVMTAVVGLQGLLFQDGGLLVMGANIFNMGILPAIIGYGLYRTVVYQKKGVRLAVAGVAAWLSVIGAALITSLQLWLSGTTRLEIVIPAMLGVHALIGIGEAIITIAALAFIEQTRPDILKADQIATSGSNSWIFVGMIITLFVLLISPFASGDPDGLERVAENLGFLETGQPAPFELLPDYTIPIFGETGFSTILAGIVGAAILMGLLILIGRNWRKQKES
jgi:cobalt/nickel transport system permease protein